MPESNEPEANRNLVRTAMLGFDQLTHAMFRGFTGNAGWERVTLRPVTIKGAKKVQFAYFSAGNCTTKNLTGPEAASQVNHLFGLQPRSVSVATNSVELRVVTSKSGKSILHRIPVRADADLRSAAVNVHDRNKAYLLQPDRAEEFLQAIGLLTADGRIRAERQRKFRQINEFLRLLLETNQIQRLTGPEIVIADYGCGNAYLTFAVVHYLTSVLERPVRMFGVDLREELLAKRAETARSLGWPNVTFHRAAIGEFTPPAPPDITVSLHACDTATDEAIWQGVRAGSRLIVSVPCCHHNLQEQIRHGAIPQPFRPVMRHGILAERLGDVLTDAFRAQILRLCGYQTDVLQFTGSDDTARNIMIRAVRNELPAPETAIAEYNALRSYWGVTPYLETLMGDDFRQVVKECQ